MRARRPATLAARMTLLGVAVAVVSLVVAGILAVGLIRRGSDAAADRTLARLADAAQRTADEASSPTEGQTRALAALSALQVAYAGVDTDGDVRAGGDALARHAVTPTLARALLGGASVSARPTVDGAAVILEARPTRDGGIVLVQRRADALRPTDDALRLLLVALAVALGIGVALSWLYARRLARPLQRTEQAARALAAGDRDVEVPPEGPRELVEVATAVNALTRSLATSEARQREFLLSVSHDLRTPLTAITGYAEALADGVTDAGDIERVGRVVLAESHRLARLVTDLLDLARLDAVTFRVDLADVDVGDVVRQAATVWRDRCAGVGVPLRLEDATGGAAALARTDPLRVRQVIDALCENALRLTPEGRPMVLAVRPDPGPPAGVTVEVRDGGPGLQEADLPVAFERGVLHDRYHGVRPVGTGLGLAIVAGLVTRLGGHARAGHAPEGGAAFTVWLPAVPPTASTPGPGPSAAVTPVAGGTARPG